LVFFDLGSSDLTPRSKKILAEERSRIKKNSRVIIVGHCDNTEQSPDALSLSRAAAVKKFLVAAGVSEAAIITGKTGEQLVPAEPADESEPQNRYAAITIE